MPASLDIAKRFFDALKREDTTAALEMLTEDAAFVSNKPAANGRRAVVDALRAHDAELIAKVTWREPELLGANVRMTGDTPQGALKLGYIVTLHFRDDKITLIQLQDIRDRRMAGSVLPQEAPAALKLPQVIKDLIKDARDKNPVVIACVDDEGYPLLSFRGSLFAFSDDQLALWIRNPEGDFVTAIAQNPRVGLMLREQANKQTFQFRGRARLSHDPAERARIYAAIPKQEQNHDFADVGAAVVIDLDWLHGYFTGGKLITMKRADTSR